MVIQPPGACALRPRPPARLAAAAVAVGRPDPAGTARQCRLVERANARETLTSNVGEAGGGYAPDALQLVYRLEAPSVAEPHDLCCSHAVNVHNEAELLERRGVDVDAGGRRRLSRRCDGESADESESGKRAHRQ
jgi:hypothetical protein